MPNDYCRSFLIKILLKLFFKNELFKKNIPFSKLARLLHNKKIILLTNKLLSLLLNKKINMIKCKTFLSIFMIKHHQKIIINDDSEVEKNVILSSNKLLDYLYKINESNNLNWFNLYKNKFENEFNIFIENFEKWKHLDKEKILNDLCIVYFELEVDLHKRTNDNNNQNNLNNNQNHLNNNQSINNENTINKNLFNKQNDDVFINDLKREQKSILNKIEKMNGLDYFNKVKDEKEKYESQIAKLYENIGKTLHLAFWDDLKHKLNKTPPDYLVIVPLLIDLKNMMKACVPNRKDIHNDIENHIDIEFISDMIKNNCIDDEYILNMINFIIGYLKKFQSKSDDKKNKKWQDKLNEQFVKGIKYSDFFPNFFKDIFEKFENILKEAELLKSMAIYEDIKDKFKKK